MTLEQLRLELHESTDTWIFSGSKYYSTTWSWLVEPKDAEEVQIRRANNKLYSYNPPRCSRVNCVVLGFFENLNFFILQFTTWMFYVLMFETNMQTMTFMENYISSKHSRYLIGL